MRVRPKGRPSLASLAEPASVLTPVTQSQHTLAGCSHPRVWGPIVKRMSATHLREALRENGITDTEIDKYLAWIDLVGNAPRTQYVPLDPPIGRAKRQTIERVLRDLQPAR